jgi:acetyltransferase
MFSIPYNAQAQPALPAASAPASAAFLTQHFVEGRTVTIRQVRSSDGAPLTGLLLSLSATTCIRRYHAARNFTGTAAQAEAARIVAARTARHRALVAAVSRCDGEEIVAVAEFARLTDDQATAELGIVVRDDMQRCGIGALLLHGVAGAALHFGIHTLQIDVQVDNVAMRRLAARFGMIAPPPPSGGVQRLLVNLDGAAFHRTPKAV